MRQLISLTIVLALMWLVNSGHYNGLLLTLGAISVLGVVALTARMNVIDHEAQPMHILGTRYIAYIVWLTKELIIANIDVTKRIWLGKKAISPTVEILPVNQKSDLAKVIYANSITLTPGTISVDLQDDQITVHALSREGIEGLKTGEMSRRVCTLEK